MTWENELSPEKPLPTEIERRFLVLAIPEDLELSQYPASNIDQGYLLRGPEGSDRIRRIGKQFFWTIKKSSTGHVAERPELQVKITRKQFETMWKGTAGRRIKKIRYEIPFGDHTIELDLFEGVNAGHMLAEVEFSSTAAADLFSPADWFDREVTTDNRYSNGNIAEFGFPQD